MVKDGMELPEVNDADTTNTTLPCSSPEWSISSISRPKMKRVGTSFPLRTRKSAKRPELASGSGISGVRKKMAFEEAEMLLAGVYGAKKGLPGKDSTLVGIVSTSSPQMEEDLKDGCNTHNLETSVGEGKASATPAQICPDEGMEASNGDVGDGEQQSNGDTTPLVEEPSPRINQLDYLPDLASPASDRADSDERNGVSTVGQPVTKGTYCTTHMKKNNKVGDALAGDALACGCDLHEWNRDNSLLNLHGNVATLLEICSNNSKCVPCTTNSPLVNEDQVILDEGLKGSHATVGSPSEISPEATKTPANVWDTAGKLHNYGKPCVGVEGFKDRATATTTHRKAEPTSLDAGKLTPMGTTGMNEGTPTISFSDNETAYLSEKVGLAIVGKFSHSLPSTTSPWEFGPCRAIHVEIHKC